MAVLKVCATPIFDQRLGLGHVLQRVLIALTLLLALAMPATAQEAPAPDEENPGFFSRIPRPKLKLPDISIPFWSDDLRTARRAYERGNYEKAMRVL